MRTTFPITDHIAGADKVDGEVRTMCRVDILYHPIEKNTATGTSSTTSRTAVVFESHNHRYEVLLCVRLNTPHLKKVDFCLIHVNNDSRSNKSWYVFDMQ